MPIVELRPLTDEDTERLFELVDTNRDQLQKFWWEKDTQQPADSRRFIAAVNVDEIMNGAPTRGICVDEKLIGVAALHTIDWEHRRSLLGYWLDTSEARKGYGTQTVKELARIAFKELDLDELEIATRESNEGSRKVAVRNGFFLRGVDEQPLWEQHEDQPIRTAHYVLTAEHYAAK